MSSSFFQRKPSPQECEYQDGQTLTAPSQERPMQPGGQYRHESQPQERNREIPTFPEARPAGLEPATHGLEIREFTLLAKFFATRSPFFATTTQGFRSVGQLPISPVPSPVSGLVYPSSRPSLAPNPKDRSIRQEDRDRFDEIRDLLDVIKFNGAEIRHTLTHGPPSEPKCPPVLIQI